MKFMLPFLIIIESAIFVVGGILIQSTGDHHPALYSAYGYFFAFAMLTFNEWAERMIILKELTQ